MFPETKPTLMITLNKTDTAWDIAAPKPEADIKIELYKIWIYLISSMVALFMGSTCSI